MTSNCYFAVGWYFCVFSRMKFLWFWETGSSRMELQSKFCAFLQFACRLLLLIPLFLLLTRVIKIQAKPLAQNCCVQNMCTMQDLIINSLQWYPVVMWLISVLKNHSVMMCVHPCLFYQGFTFFTFSTSSLSLAWSKYLKNYSCFNNILSNL